MPSEQSLLQTSGARAVFWAFNDSRRARLHLDLAKEKSMMFQLQRKLKDVHNTKTDGYTAWPFAMAESQSPQKKTNHKSTVSRNNVHTTAPKGRRRHYMDQINKSKTLKSKTPKKKQKKTSEFTEAAQRVGVTSKLHMRTQTPAHSERVSGCVQTFKLQDTTHVKSQDNTNHPNG